MAWRKIKNARIQTFAKEVFLWDTMMGVATRVAVPSRPWTKIDPDFNYWMSAEGYAEGEFPSFIPAGEKPNPAHFEAKFTGLIMESESGELFLQDRKDGSIISV